ncbi:hypothetical protein SPSIL_018320 [Sporomusa silvacetica DSM 10669]|uniref:TM2 domain protein n=1 Tax=Sporomusa silvacetica DSM 10669 TaxID=1123289 RepID=A0ABZ3IJ34_9FIRM|nr:hypothetical protein [Sporomusa silvacetica]OZC18909.1 hypothetical protein SPSIL_25230 [Sporomusa silvacetica DSM 10669]
MNNSSVFPNDPRQPKAYVSSLTTNLIHLRSPYITALWSIIFPGFGHIILGSYVKGFLFIIWEIIINTQSHLNIVILYTFTGHFNEATAAADSRWFLLYITVYVYAAWDSYRSTVDLNKFSILADRADTPLTRFKMDSFEINYFDKRNPWVAAVWSMLSPGVGHLYTHQLPTGFIVIILWIVITYYSHLLQVIQYTLHFDFNQAVAVSDPEWLLFMPSIYCFAFYDAYVNTVEYNKLFDGEQANFLKRTYQNGNYLKQFFPPGEEDVFIISTFEHSMYLELAISDLEIRGIPRNQIFAASMEKKQKPMFLIDTIHRADGVGTMDVACITGAFTAVLGGVYGYIWYGGPLLWGLIGLTLGFIVGGSIDIFVTKKKRRLVSSDSSTEVVLIIKCEPVQTSLVEEVLTRHLALGMTQVNSLISTASTLTQQ